MTTANITSGSMGGDSIGFTAHEPFPDTQVYRLKGCELCPKMFLTLAMAPMRDCLQCRERTAKREAELDIPAIDPPVKPNRPLHYRKASDALSMRATA